MRELEKLVERMAEACVELVIVGGFAATAHGATRISEDLDILIPFDEGNLTRLLEALSPTNPRFREGRRALPSARELASYRNLYLETDWGDLDVLGEIAAVGRFEAAKARSVALRLFGKDIHLLDLEALIESKRALNREKDREALRELELIAARRKGG